jgi:hypothetical protein
MDSVGFSHHMKTNQHLQFAHMLSLPVQALSLCYSRVGLRGGLSHLEGLMVSVSV